MGLSKSWEKGFNIASQAALSSDAPSPGRRMGAAILRSGNIVSVGWNMVAKSHPECEYTIHAEHAALIAKRHREDFIGCVMYVYRQRVSNLKHGTINYAISKPCKQCQILCKTAGIRTIRYFDINGNAKEMDVR